MAETLPVFELSPTQKEVFWDDRRFIYMNGGRRTGKSSSACLRIIGMIERGEIRPGGRISVFGPTYPQMIDGTLKTFDEFFGAPTVSNPKGQNLIVRSRDGNQPQRWLVDDIEATFRNGSNPDQTRSREGQVVWLDEAAQMPERILQLTNATMTQFGDDAIHQTIITSTPRGRNWLFQSFVNGGTRKWSDDLVGYYHTTSETEQKRGLIRKGYIEELGYDKNSQMYRQEVLAEFVTWSGLVFEQEWILRDPEDDDGVQRKPVFKRVYAGVDIGVSSPTCILLVGEDERGAIWVFKEFYKPRADLHEWLPLAMRWHHDYRVRRWYVDSAADREIATMRAAGLPVHPSIKAKDAAGTAVNYINSLIKRGMFYIAPSCFDLRRELEGYEFKEIQKGDEVTFLDKVKPNQPDHACDALRYGVLPLSSASGQEAYGQVLVGRYG